MAKKRISDMGRQIVEEYECSGMTRREFCERSNIPVTTLDYWRRRKAQAAKPRLVEVTVATPESSAGFTMILRSGRRLEIPVNFHEPALRRLIRIVEST